MAYSYVAHGKLKDDIYARFFQPVFSIILTRKVERNRAMDSGEVP